MELINLIKITTSCLNNTVDGRKACTKCHKKQKNEHNHYEGQYRLYRGKLIQER